MRVGGFDKGDRLTRQFRDRQAKGATGGTGLVERHLGGGTRLATRGGRRREEAPLPLNGGRWNGHAPRFGDTRCRILNLHISPSLLPKHLTHPMNG